jgi:5'-nucleotidase (lipoprotein e(P4) family)
MKTTTHLVKLNRLLAFLFIATASISTTSAQTAASQAKQADNEYQTGAVLWFQSSGEVRALQYQAYSLARLMLDRDFRLHGSDKRRRAVVVDVDETVLDNSRYQASLIVNQKPYEAASWTAWCNRAEATAIPGAVEFLRYAVRRGVHIFYVTNRRAAEKEGTARNLKQLGFPQVSNETLLLRADTASKEPRRQSLSKRYRIVLLAGDNLNDFTNLFEGKSVEDRAAAVNAAQQKFGTQFIILPNPMYGDWESAIYKYNSQLKEEEKAKLRREALKTEQQ